MNKIKNNAEMMVRIRVHNIKAKLLQIKILV